MASWHDQDSFLCRGMADARLAEARQALENCVDPFTLWKPLNTQPF
jgi:hypothetical protein